MKSFDAIIRSFPEQLTWQPVVENGNLPTAYEFVIAAGMGGSSLGAFLLRAGDLSLPVFLHRDYGLPQFPDSIMQKSIVIASSYSGNTEETIDAFCEALRRHLPVACVSTGGTLLKMARTHGVPYVQVPNTDIQPRSAVGFMIRALLKLLDKDEELQALEKVVPNLSMDILEEEGRSLAEKLKGFFPLIYASGRNEAIAYNWKIRFNETGKIAAFSNIFPELTHNENMGFEFSGAKHVLPQPFAVVILRDPSDHPRILLRMEIITQMYRARNIPVILHDLIGATVWERIVCSLCVCDWAGYYTARAYGLDVDGEKTVEEFKDRMSRPSSS